MDIISYAMGQKSASGGSTPTPTNVVLAEITNGNDARRVNNELSSFTVNIESPDNNSYTDFDITLGQARLSTEVTIEDESSLSDISMDAVNGNVAISGSSGDNYVELRLDASNNTIEVQADHFVVPTPTDREDATNKRYVDNYLSSISGYDETKTQILKNVNGTLTWVDETGGDR